MEGEFFINAARINAAEIRGIITPGGRERCEL